MPVGIKKREVGLNAGSEPISLALARIGLPTDTASCFEGLAQTFKFVRRHLRLLRSSLGHTVNGQSFMSGFVVGIRLMTGPGNALPEFSRRNSLDCSNLGVDRCAGVKVRLET